MIEFVAYLLVISMAFTVMAVYFSVINWKRWKEIETDTIKARVFLDRQFLNLNFKITLVSVILVGGMATLHLLMECFELAGFKFSGFYLLYYGMLPVATGILTILAYLWHKLLTMKLKQI